MNVSPPRPLRSPDLNELETLVVCAAEGSMAGAAAQLGISRPAIAKRIRNLEALAGQPLLRRSGRGVALTGAGATLLAGARRMLDERNALLEVLGRIREDDGAREGLGKLLGDSPAFARASQQPEARLAEAQRLLELVLQASSTCVVISDPDTGAVHAVNDAFCEFVGRTRRQLMERAPAECRVWEDVAVRDAMIEQARREASSGVTTIHVRRADDSVRAGQATVRFITLGGTRKVLWTVEDAGDSAERGSVEGRRSKRSPPAHSLALARDGAVGQDGTAPAPAP